MTRADSPQTRKPPFEEGWILSAIKAPVPTLALQLVDGVRERVGRVYQRVSPDIKNLHAKLAGNLPLVEKKWTILVVHGIPEGMDETHLRFYFTKFFIDNPHSVIEFSKNLSPEDRRRMTVLVQKNYPMVSILRLPPEHQIVDITFIWIKSLNDDVSMEFTNRIRAEFWKILLKRMSTSSVHLRGENVRVMRDQCKHFSVSIPDSTDPIQFLLPHSDRRKLIEEVIQNSLPYLREYSRKNRKHSVDSLKEKIRVSFDLWIWAWKTQSSKGENLDMERIEAFRSAESHARVAERESKIITNRGTEWEVIKAANRLMQTEDEMCERYKNTSFTFEGASHSAAIPEGSGVRINPELLKIVKKESWEGISPRELAIEVAWYIQELNDYFDFIAPAKNFEEDIAYAHSIDALLREGKIRSDMMLQDYKGTLTREALYIATQGKKWMKIFVDVKEMGFLNLESFRATAREIARTGDVSLALKTGMDVTKRFIGVVERIQKKYPNAQISLGWDEMYMFFPEVDKTAEQTIFDKISESLEKEGLQWRMTHSFETATAPDKIFESLSTKAQVSKFFERWLKKFSLPSSKINSWSIHILGNIPDVGILEETSKKQGFFEFIKHFWDDLQAGRLPIKREYETDFNGKPFVIQAEASRWRINFFMW